jgi:hypothetical protein
VYFCVCIVQELRAKLDASREEVERLDAQLQGAAAEHSRQLQEQEEKVGVVGLLACFGRCCGSCSAMHARTHCTHVRMPCMHCSAHAVVLLFSSDRWAFLVSCWPPVLLPVMHSYVLLYCSRTAVVPQLLVDKAAAERRAAEALQAERSRAQQLQQQLAEQAATAAEHQRCLQAQLSDLGQQLAGTSEEVERLGGQLRQAQEGVASRDAELARLQGQLSQVGPPGGMCQLLMGMCGVSAVARSPHI